MLCLLTLVLIVQTYAWTRDDCQRVALEWKSGNVPYAQSTKYNTKQHVTYGKGPYRSDCSGFVSAAWDVAPPGETTRTIVHTKITKDQLVRCDALLDAGSHVALFWGWADAAKTKPIVIEEYTTGRFTEERTWSSLRGFQPIRRVGWTGSSSSGGSSPVPVPQAPSSSGSTGVGTSCTVSGVAGVCISTQQCGAEGGVSTPGYCPGAATVQCCTKAAAGGSCQTTTAVNLRSCGSTSCSILRVLSAGQVVSKVSVSGGWTQVSSPAAGWVSSTYLSCSSGLREADQSSTDGPNVGLIVGCTVGGLVVLCALIGLTVFLVKRNQTNAQPERA